MARERRLQSRQRPKFKPGNRGETFAPVRPAGLPDDAVWRRGLPADTIPQQERVREADAPRLPDRTRTNVPIERRVLGRTPNFMAIINSLQPGQVAILDTIKRRGGGRRRMRIPAPSQWPAFVSRTGRPFPYDTDKYGLSKPLYDLIAGGYRLAVPQNVIRLEIVGEDGAPQREIRRWKNQRLEQPERYALDAMRRTRSGGKTVAPDRYYRRGMGPLDNVDPENFAENASMGQQFSARLRRIIQRFARPNANSLDDQAFGLRPVPPRIADYKKWTKDWRDTELKRAEEAGELPEGHDEPYPDAVKPPRKPQYGGLDFDPDEELNIDTRRPSEENIREVIGPAVHDARRLALAGLPAHVVESMQDYEVERKGQKTIIPDLRGNLGKSMEKISQLSKKQSQKGLRAALLKKELEKPSAISDLDRALEFYTGSPVTLLAARAALRDARARGGDDESFRSNILPEEVRNALKGLYYGRIDETPEIEGMRNRGIGGALMELDIPYVYNERTKPSLYGPRGLRSELARQSRETSTTNQDDDPATNPLNRLQGWEGMGKGSFAAGATNHVHFADDSKADNLASAGIFIRLPESIACNYPAKSEDDSPPHITVLYIGKVPHEHRDAYRAVLEAAVSNSSIGSVTLKPKAWFENEDGKQIAHNPVECEGLSALRKRVWDALDALGYHVGDSFRRHKPHATIAYCDEKKCDSEGWSGTFTPTHLELWGFGRAIKVPVHNVSQKAVTMREPFTMRQSFSIGTAEAGPGNLNHKHPAFGRRRRRRARNGQMFARTAPCDAINLDGNQKFAMPNRWPPGARTRPPGAFGGPAAGRALSALQGPLGGLIRQPLSLNRATVPGVPQVLQTFGAISRGERGRNRSLRHDIEGQAELDAIARGEYGPERETQQERDRPFDSTSAFLINQDIKQGHIPTMIGRSPLSLYLADGSLAPYGYSPSGVAELDHALRADDFDSYRGGQLLSTSLERMEARRPSASTLRERAKQAGKRYIPGRNAAGHEFARDDQPAPAPQQLQPSPQDGAGVQQLLATLLERLSAQQAQGAMGGQGQAFARKQMPGGIDPRTGRKLRGPRTIDLSDDEAGLFDAWRKVSDKIASRLSASNITAPTGLLDARRFTNPAAKKGVAQSRKNLDAIAENRIENPVDVSQTELRLNQLGMGGVGPIGPTDSPEALKRQRMERFRGRSLGDIARGMGGTQSFAVDPGDVRRQSRIGDDDILSLMRAHQERVASGQSESRTRTTGLGAMEPIDLPSRPTLEPIEGVSPGSRVSRSLSGVPRRSISDVYAKRRRTQGSGIVGRLSNLLRPFIGLHSVAAGRNDPFGGDVEPPDYSGNVIPISRLSQRGEIGRDLFKTFHQKNPYRQVERPHPAIRIRKNDRPVEMSPKEAAAWIDLMQQERKMTALPPLRDGQVNSIGLPRTTDRAFRRALWRDRMKGRRGLGRTLSFSRDGQQFDRSTPSLRLIKGGDFRPRVRRGINYLMDKSDQEQAQLRAKAPSPAAATMPGTPLKPGAPSNRPKPAGYVSALPPMPRQQAQPRRSIIESAPENIRGALQRSRDAAKARRMGLNVPRASLNPEARGWLSSQGYRSDVNRGVYTRNPQGRQVRRDAFGNVRRPQQQRGFTDWLLDRDGRTEAAIGRGIGRAGSAIGSGLRGLRKRVLGFSRDGMQEFGAIDRGTIRPGETARGAMMRGDAELARIARGEYGPERENVIGEDAVGAGVSGNEGIPYRLIRKRRIRHIKEEMGTPLSNSIGTSVPLSAYPHGFIEIHPDDALEVQAAQRSVDMPIEIGNRFLQAALNAKERRRPSASTLRERAKQAGTRYIPGRNERGAQFARDDMPLDDQDFAVENIPLNRLRPPHQAVNKTLLEKLTAAMAAGGYQGRPLVGIKGKSREEQIQSLVGSHRIQAAINAGLKEVPVDLLPPGVRKKIEKEAVVNWETGNIDPLIIADVIRKKYPTTASNLDDEPYWEDDQEFARNDQPAFDPTDIFNGIGANVARDVGAPGRWMGRVNEGTDAALADIGVSPKWAKRLRRGAIIADAIGTPGPLAQLALAGGSRLMRRLKQRRPMANNPNDDQHFMPFALRGA